MPYMEEQYRNEFTIPKVTVAMCLRILTDTYEAAKDAGDDDIARSSLALIRSIVNAELEAAS